MSIKAGESVADLEIEGGPALEQLAEVQVVAGRASAESRPLRETVGRVSLNAEKSGQIVIGLTGLLAVLTLAIVLLRT